MAEKKAPTTKGKVDPAIKRTVRELDDQREPREPNAIDTLNQTDSNDGVAQERAQQANGIAG